MSYVHGVYASLGATQHASPAASSSIPVYIGSAPLHLAAHPATVNEPVLISSWADAIDKLGMAWDFTRYDLSEAVFAHFGRAQAVGPIVAIPVFDPAVMRVEQKVTASVTMANGLGYITDMDAIPDTIAISGKALGTDFSLTVDVTGGRIAVKDLAGTMSSPVSITYTKADPSKVTAVRVVGENSDGNVTGIQALSLVYPLIGVVPSMVCAPRFAGDADVYTALSAAAEAVSDKFKCIVLANIPSASGTGARTVETAIAKKAALGMIQEGTVVCWPMVKISARVIHAAVAWIVRQMQVDNAAGGLPYESASNKVLEDVSGVCFEGDAGTVVTLTAANQLNAAGITTVMCWGGSWRIWGAHSAAYVSGGDFDERAEFIGNMRMMYYICNEITVKYWDEIDKPITKNMRETLVTGIQGWLDGLKSSGALCYGVCALDDTVAGDSDMTRFAISLSCAVTSVPPLEAINVKVCYTSEGIEYIFE